MPNSTSTSQTHSELLSNYPTVKPDEIELTPVPSPAPMAKRLTIVKQPNNLYQNHSELLPQDSPVEPSPELFLRPEYGIELTSVRTQAPSPVPIGELVIDEQAPKMTKQAQMRAEQNQVALPNSEKVDVGQMDTAIYLNYQMLDRESLRKYEQFKFSILNQTQSDKSKTRKPANEDVQVWSMLIVYCF